MPKANPPDTRTDLQRPADGARVEGLTTIYEYADGTYSVMAYERDEEDHLKLRWENDFDDGLLAGLEVQDYLKIREKERTHEP